MKTFVHRVARPFTAVFATFTVLGLIVAGQFVFGGSPATLNSRTALTGPHAPSVAKPAPSAIKISGNTTTIAIPDIGTFADYEDSNTSDTFTGTGFVGMYNFPAWAHLLGLESSGFSRTLMQADLSSFSGKNVISAVLSFDVVDGSCGTAHGLRATVFRNDPGNLTFTFDPPATNFGSADFTVQGCGSQSLDLTPLVAQAVAAGVQWVGIHLSGTDNNANMWTYTYSGFGYSPDRANVRLAIAAAGCTAPPSGMVGWWPGEGDANDIQDGNDGTFNGTPAYAPAEVRQGFSFNGTDQYVEVPDSADLSMTGPMTIDAWIKPNDNNTEHGIVEKYDGGGSKGYFFRLSPGGHLTFGVANDSIYDVVTGGTQVSTGVFHHVAATYDGSSINVYLDGVLDGTQGTGVAPTDGVSPLEIGSRGGNPGNFFNGVIDEVEMFNRALSADEILAIKDAGPAGKCRSCAGAPGSLVNWWKAENDATDSQGSKNGTLTNTAFTSGEVGQAFSFPAANSYVDVGDVDLPVTFTIDAWVNPADLSQYPMIISKDDAGSSRSYFVNIDSGGTLTASVKNANGDFTQYRTASAVITTGSWQHIAVTYDGNAGPGERFKFYVNGASEPATVLCCDNGGVPENNALSTKIGMFGDGASNGFIGAIDEVEIFDRALSQREVQKIYDALGGGKCPCTSAPEDMVSWWGLDGNTADIKGGNDLTLLNGPGFVVGEVGQALNFTGGQAATPGLPSNLNITGNQVTIDGWVNMNATQHEGTFFGKTRSGQNDYTLFMLSDQLAGCIRTADGTEHFLYTGYVPPNGQWTHIAQVYDGTNQTIYANGQPIASQPVSGNVRGDGVNFYIGGRENGNELTINAAIDEVEVFNRGLTGDEIAALYHAGGAGKCRPYFTVTANAGTGGAASGGGTFRQGTIVELSATPNDCYGFKGWYEDGQLVSSSNPYDFAVRGNRTLLAMFDKIQYTISANASPPPGGTISGDGQYDCGSQVTLTANPGSCYTFVNWTENGTQVSTSATYSFAATANRTLVANFGKNGYIISASASPSGGGTVTGGGGYSCGSQATVTAHANSGYQFFNWTENGNVVSTSASYTFSVTANRSLVANFKRPTTQISASGAISRPNNKQATFSYGYKVGQRTTSTAFNYRDPGSNVSISTNAVGSVTFSFNHVHVTGTYKVGTSTRSFVADFADNGPNGAGDQFSISVSPGGYSASGNLISGDIYIH